jgi:hypothetical protein
MLYYFLYSDEEIVREAPLGRQEASLTYSCLKKEGQGHNGRKRDPQSQGYPSFKY